MSDAFDARIRAGALPPLPDDSREAATPPRMPDLVRSERLRSEVSRWSEAYLARQLARAVARGRRTQ